MLFQFIFLIICSPNTVFCEYQTFLYFIVHSILLFILFVSKAYGYIPLLKYVQVVCLKSNEIKEETNVERHN